MKLFSSDLKILLSVKSPKHQLINQKHNILIFVKQLFYNFVNFLLPTKHLHFYQLN